MEVFKSKDKGENNRVCIGKKKNEELETFQQIHRVSNDSHP